MQPSPQSTNWAAGQPSTPITAFSPVIATTAAPPAQLHTGLCDLGYYPGDEDIDDFYFGEGTQSALMTMQVGQGGASRLAVHAFHALLLLWHARAACSNRRRASQQQPHLLHAVPATTPFPQCCEGLEETGIADAATWAKLLGDSLAPKPSRDLTADMMVNVPGLSKLTGGGGDSSSSGDATASAAADASGSKPAYAELFSAAFSETVAPTAEGGLQDVQQLRVTDQVAAGGKLVSDTVQVEQRVVVAPEGDSAQVSTSVKADHKETYTGGWGAGLAEGRSGWA